MKNAKLFGAISVALLLLLCAVGWSVRWEYDEAPLRRGLRTETVKIRTNRYTGETQRLTDSGWYSMHRVPPKPRPPLEERERAALETQRCVSRARTKSISPKRIAILCDVSLGEARGDPFSDITDRYLAGKPGS